MECVEIRRGAHTHVEEKRSVYGYIRAICSMWAIRAPNERVTREELGRRRWCGLDGGWGSCWSMAITLLLRLLLWLALSLSHSLSLSATLAATLLLCQWFLCETLDAFDALGLSTVRQTRGMAKLSAWLDSRYRQPTMWTHSALALCLYAARERQIIIFASL